MELTTTRHTNVQLVELVGLHVQSVFISDVFTCLASEFPESSQSGCGNVLFYLICQPIRLALGRGRVSYYTHYASPARSVRTPSVHGTSSELNHQAGQASSTKNWQLAVGLERFLLLSIARSARNERKGGKGYANVQNLMNVAARCFVLLVQTAHVGCDARRVAKN